MIAHHLKGVLEGEAVGFLDGFTVGLPVGFLEGITVGMRISFARGVWVGLAEGWVVGGLAVGWLGATVTIKYTYDVMKKR